MMRADRAVIIAVLMVGPAMAPLQAQEPGYWQLQAGEASVEYGPPGNQTEWLAQGVTVIVKEASPAGATITESNTIAGDLNRMTFRTEWQPPAQVVPGEVVAFTASASVLELSYGRPQWPRNFEVALCQWLGVGGPVELTPLMEIPAKSVGQSFTSTNSSVRARGPDPGMVPGPAKLLCGLSLNAYYGLKATFPYRWVTGNVPTAAAPAVPPDEKPPVPPVAAPATPTRGASSPSGTWDTVVNGSSGALELTQNGGVWRGRFDVGAGWEEMQNLRICGSSISFERARGGQHYSGQIASDGISGRFWEGQGSNWSATRQTDSGPPPAGTGSAGAAPSERELFFNGNTGGVANGGRSPSVSFDRQVTLASVTSYHWNDGRGPTRSGTIALLHESGTLYGPWSASVVDKFYWEVQPNQQLPSGRYQVIDSDPATWAQNAQSEGFGHVRIRGH